MLNKAGVSLVIAAFLLSFICPEAISAKQEVKQEQDIYEQIELFTDAVSAVEMDYVEEVPPKDMVYGALKGLLSSLDPHSQFLEPDVYEEMKVETTGEFGGIGIEITIKDELLTIISPIDDTPADRAGIKAGDRIVKINDEVTRDITLFEAVKKLRGKPGTTVDLTIMREKENRFLEVTIKRDIIKIKSIKDAKIVDDGIGYIRLSEFQEKTPRDLDKAINDLRKQGMDSLILDLRNNPGGLLNIAIDVAEKFIPQGEMIVQTKGRIKGQNLEFRSKRGKKYLDMPLVIMINDGSASGSEIVAGAIQDLKRGVVLGTKSFGKGSVQTIIPLRDGSALRLTTSKYFTPSERVIHGEGIEPDVIVEEKKFADEEKENETSKAEEIFEKIDEDEEKDEPEKEKPYDNQLESAIDVIKAIKVYRTFEKK
jgi:carboxyl-terminal processing protease